MRFKVKGELVIKKEGDLITPKGEFKIKCILYRKDRIKKIQSKIQENCD